jgi:hypothetical protein
MVTQVILLQVKLCQAEAGTKHRGQVLAADGRKATAHHPAGEMHMVIVPKGLFLWVTAV